MAKIKNQLFLDERPQSILNGLCARFGWSSGQAVERLLFYYTATQRTVSFLDVDIFDDRWGGPGDIEMVDGSEPGCVILSDPSECVAPEVCATSQTIVRVVETIKDGLTPLNGFALDSDEEGD